MTEEMKNPDSEEACRPLTDEEFREYPEKDARSTRKVLMFFEAVWETVIDFFS